MSEGTAGSSENIANLPFRQLNLILVVLGCFLTYAALSGLVSQIGTLSALIAGQFSKPLTQAAAQFSWFSTGITVGSLLSLVACVYLSLRRALFVCYSVFIAGLLSIGALDSWTSLPVLFFVIGAAGSLGLNTGAVTLSLSFSGRQQAAALLITDIFFAGAGIVVAPVSVSLIESGAPWYVSFWLLAAVSTAILVIAFFGRYPQTARERQEPLRKRVWPLSVYLSALGLALYLCAQITIMIWLPNFIDTGLNAGMDVGAMTVSRYWTGMVIGQIILVILLLHCPPRYLLFGILIISVFVSCGLWLSDAPPMLALISIGLGLSNAGILKLTISFASSLVEHPQRVVTFLLFSSACGQAVSPLVSSGLVETFGMRFGLQLASGLYLLTAITLICALIFAAPDKRMKPHDA